MVRRFGPAAAALLAALVSACAFLGADQFPSYLEYAIARKKLGPVFADAGLSDPVWVSNLRILTSSSGVSRLFLTTASWEGQRLFVFDDDDLRLLKVVDDPLLIPSVSSFLSVTPTGDNFLCGGLEFDAATLAVVATTWPTMGYDAEVRSFSDGTDLYLIRSNAPGFQCLRLDAGMGISNIGPNYLPAAYPDAVALDARIDSGAVRVLFNSDDAGLVLRYADAALFWGAFAAADLAVNASAQFTIDALHDRGGWLTADGAVALSHENDSMLTRYRFDTGTELDRVPMEESDGERRVAFQSSGGKRAFYDARSGYLHLLRTWWK